jgi:hypothetical protein
LILKHRTRLILIPCFLLTCFQRRVRVQSRDCFYCSAAMTLAPLSDPYWPSSFGCQGHQVDTSFQKTSCSAVCSLQCLAVSPKGVSQGAVRDAVFLFTSPAKRMDWGRSSSAGFTGLEITGCMSESGSVIDSFGWPNDSVCWLLLLCASYKKN